MTTLKKGSKGEDVKTLQKYLGITVDGDFGAKTEAAVVAYQKAHGLTADGIVGAKTWALLTGSSTTDSKCVDPSVIYNPLNVHITHKANREIKYIAIHFTAGSRSTKGVANNVKNVFKERQASADFCVDDEQMMQFNPDLRNYYCWAVGDKASTSEGGASLAGKAFNSNTISIEICSTLKSGYSFCSNHDGWSYTDRVLENARKLTRILMKKFDIPNDRVVRHYDISGKLCPGIIGWNNGRIRTKAGMSTTEKNNSSEWLKFKESL